MKKQIGLSMMSLMAVVAIIAALATLSLPIYNQYLERSKAASAIPSVGNYKQGVAQCFLFEHSLDECSAG